MKELPKKIRSDFTAKTKLPYMGLRVVFCLASGFFTLQSNTVHAQPCSELGGWVVSVEGVFTVAGKLTKLGEEICSGDEISVGHGSRVAIRLASSQTVVRVNQNTSFVIEPSGTDGYWLRLLNGIIYLFSRRPESFGVETPYVNAAIDGTEFVIETSAESSEVTVIEGTVWLSNAEGRVRLTPGEYGNAGSNNAPQRRTVINQEDAVQWALYYPPIGATENTNAVVRSAAKILARGDVESAEALLSSSIEDAASLALMAIIAVKRNQSGEALQLAQRAIIADPTSSMAYTALSYAQQAGFDIDQALVSANLAVRNDSRNADALARQAELQLGVDESADALESAQNAVRIDPDNSRARTILGFVQLVRLEVDKAQETFSKAVDLDSGDPLPRMGLGLSFIRDGRLIEGREHIEVAASLDPANALIRSYLGKAYFEEGQTGDASAQLELAKGLDPQDPTSWLYDAVLLQSLNQPAEAFENLTTANNLNDNTLVYRSRSLVDKSEAAGTLGLASIYADLGFQQLAVNEGSRSIAKDPTNFAAYRFLANSYEERERHESARRNILFQSTLLQPMTISPVQPEARESDLRILPGAGPSDPSVNEYTPLFDGDGLQLFGSILGGNQGTFGDRLVLSGLGGRAAFSLGQFHYQTDGFRTNADVKHDLYSLLIQAQPSPNLTLQAEYHDRQTEEGDLSLNFNPDNFNQLLRKEIKSETPRLGMRFSPDRRSTLLMSVLRVNVEENELLPFSPEDTLISNLTEEGLSVLGQFTYQGEKYHHTIGADFYDLDVSLSREFDPCSIEPCQLVDQNDTSTFGDVYYYADVKSNESLVWRVGINYSIIDDEAFRIDEKILGPRLGVRWDVSESLSLRSVIAKGIRKRRVADLSMEPVVLAGFNQLYDDIAGTRYLNAGIGIDWHFDQSTTIGVEGHYRDLDVPRLILVEAADSVDTVSQDESQNEATIRAYWYHVVNKRFSLAFDLLVERFSRDNFLDPQGQLVSRAPLEVNTITMPITASYFNPSGLFLKGRISYVIQDLDFLPPQENGFEEPQSFNEDNESFASLDLTVGYRIPRLKGDFRFEVNNLLDEDFLYQDQNIQSDVSGNPRYSPGRTFNARLSINL